MKKLFKSLFLLVMSGLLVVSTTACDKKTEEPATEQPTVEEPAATPEQPGTPEGTPEHVHSYSESWSSDKDNHFHACTGCEEVKDSAAHTGGKADYWNKAVCEVCGTPYGTVVPCEHKETEPQSNSKYHWNECTECHKALDKAAHFGGTASETVEAVCEECGESYGGFYNPSYAKGAHSYVAASYDERAKILGILEKYAVKNNLTGLTLYENGGFIMYADSVVKGTETYIPGYGFGILSEGYLSEDLPGENNAAWKQYYHTFQTEDPGTINYMNDKGSVVGDLVSYVSSSYWTTQMNEAANGYEWVGAQSASERPIAVNGTQYGDQVLATKYKFEVKVGADYKYTTLSKVPALAAFNNTEVKLEDYVTAYQMLFTKQFGMARATDNLDGAGSIKGSAEYYEASADGINETAWEKVGIKAYTEGGKSYLEIEFNTPCNQFYAMYYLSSSLSTPVPAEFIKALGNGDMAKGMAVYGNKTDAGWTPVDTYLSTGPYVLERWDADQQIVFAKNPNYTIEGEYRYKIAGVHMNILKAATTDPLASFNEFLAGKLHAVSIPLQKLEEYKNDPRTTSTVGSSTFKLNFNTCTPKEWAELFGVAGTITQTTIDKYWECEPFMSNDDFIAGISYAINRVDFATRIGRTASANYFGSGYLADPENGIMYNATQYHKDAVASLQEGTEYGYNLEFAKKSFKKAADKLIADGVYKKGDKFEIEIAWMYPADEDEYHAFIKQYIEEAWNAANTGLTLEVKFWVGSQWSDVYYNKMMLGQFDIGFGSISGNTLNPLNFFEVLKSDNSSGFTLNWGCDTSEVSEDLFYDGMYWSFDSLWIAADQGGYFENGQLVPAVETPEYITTHEENADGTYTITFDIDIAVAEGLEVTIDNAVIFAYIGEKPAYAEESVGFEFEDGTLTATLTAEQYAKYSACVNEAGYVGLDVYYTVSVNGIDSSALNSVYFNWN